MTQLPSVFQSVLQIVLHGVRIAVSVDPRDAAPARRALAEYELDASGRGADIAFRMSALPRPDLGTWQPAFETEAVRVFERDDGEVLLANVHAHATISADGRRITASSPPDGADPRAFIEATFRSALAFALRKHGLYDLHAGALLRPDGRRILIVGASGAGKTTTTLALLGPGASVLGDDSMLVAERGGVPVVLAYPRPFHVTPTTLAAFPSAAAGPVDARGKHDVPLAAIPARRSAEMAAPDVVLFPSVAREPVTRGVPVPAADGLGRVLEGSAGLGLLRDAAASAAQVRLLGRLLAGARMWELRLGADALADRGRVAAVVDALCER